MQAQASDANAEKLLLQMQHRRDTIQLVEMNGERCAMRQLFDLRIYDRPQRPVVQNGD